MMTRRIFLKNGSLALVSLGFAPAFVARAAQAAEARQKILITIFQRGAVDGLNMIVPHGEKASTSPAKEVAVRRHHERARGALPRDVQAANDRDRNSIGLAHHELGCARELVGDRDLRRLELVADAVTRTAEVFDDADACGAERDIDCPLPPRASERVRDQDRDLVAGQLVEAFAEARGRSIRVVR